MSEAVNSSPLYLVCDIPLSELWLSCLLGMLLASSKHILSLLKCILTRDSPGCHSAHTQGLALTYRAQESGC